ncbi:hypothetical protein H261_05304 [Paramagnetospirillum caucaseum]|uniref:Uncharacterized protein n=1 Tax=Paramagnetospirillum caucaseum TaxID=1244869 RepID=M3ADV6_9PROT|nr:hypothetical protein [Paramagnetospirillum caucaseum]EME70978.1 hypothetical protein H261_05304 [Paramagnetospirillum caucaseum]
MNLFTDPWRLPSAAAFLDEAEAALDCGLAVLANDDSMPYGFDEGLRARLRARDWIVETVRPVHNAAPAKALGEAFGAAANLDGLLTSSLYEHVAVIDVSRLSSSDQDAWRVFLKRFIERRATLSGGLALIIMGIPKGWAVAPDLPLLVWGDRVRRLDVTIWADMHAPIDRPELLASLATALAVDLCAWRLDLAASIAQAGKQDLFDPIGWLERQDSPPIAGVRRFGSQTLGCPILLLKEGHCKELDRRIWRAHVAAIFPWLEERRQGLVDQYRKWLHVDNHLRMLGVDCVEEIELGALAWQLEGKVTQQAAAYLKCLARIRNNLAHRNPAFPGDIQTALRDCDLFE